MADLRELDGPHFGTDPWRLRETWADPARAGVAETLFAVGNGWLGVRAAPDEGGGAARGAFVNGFHATFPIVYPEESYGYARVGQTIVAVPDASVLRVEAGGAAFDLAGPGVEAYERTLDFQRGSLSRRVVWQSPAGRLRLSSERLVSLADQALALFAVEVEAVDGDIDVAVVSELAEPLGAGRGGAADGLGRVGSGVSGLAGPAGCGVAPDGLGRVGSDVSGMIGQVGRVGSDVSGPAGPAGREAAPNAWDPRRADWLDRPLICEAVAADADEAALASRAAGSGLAVGVAVDHRVEGAAAEVAADVGAASVRQTFRFRALAGQPVRLAKRAAYAVTAGPAGEALAAARAALAAAPSAGGLRDRQRAWLDAFWERSDVTVAGPGAAPVQQAVRWTLFQLAQATAQTAGQGVAAKGVTGSGYSGHYFWDTEIFVLPFLTY
ncbi:MAG: hypothetical protein LBH76_02795, partial [Propionibacteriaceae bacterium]|nr:hypothetical protein [Propionibacteriaceae bacterium]